MQPNGLKTRETIVFSSNEPYVDFKVKSFFLLIF